MKSQEPKNICAACGWRHLNEPQRSASGGASHEICPSCGFESGYTDDDQGITYEQWRATWVSNGLKWSSKGIEVPLHWNPLSQVHALLQRKRPVISQIRLRHAAALREGEALEDPKRKAAKKQAQKSK